MHSVDRAWERARLGARRRDLHLRAVRGQCRPRALRPTRPVRRQPLWRWLDPDLSEHACGVVRRARRAGRTTLRATALPARRVPAVSGNAAGAIANADRARAPPIGRLGGWCERHRHERRREDAAGAVGGGHDDDEGGWRGRGGSGGGGGKKVNGGRETLSRARAKKREERAPNVGERIADASTDLDGEEEEDVEGGGIVPRPRPGRVWKRTMRRRPSFRKQSPASARHDRPPKRQQQQKRQQRWMRHTALTASGIPRRRRRRRRGGDGRPAGVVDDPWDARGRGETATPREVVARQHVEHMQKVRKLEEAAVHLAAASPSKRVDATAAAAEDQESHAPYDVIAAAGGAGSASDGSDSDDEDDDAAEEEEEGERGADAADARALEMAREWAASRHLIEAPPGAAAATAAVNERPPPATRRNARGRPPVEAPMARGEGQRPSPRPRRSAGSRAPQ